MEFKFKKGFWSQLKIMMIIRFKAFLRSPKMWIYLFFLFGPRIIIDEIVKYVGG